MKIHYFQRYHSKENVATANTMLLLSRLYSYSADKFFRLLKSENFFNDAFEPELIFNLQEKSMDSIPDATISQESFKIVVETKMSDWFKNDQLFRHLSAFGDEKYKVLITLAPVKMKNKKMVNFDKRLKEYNLTQKYPVMHVNTTFERISEAIQELIDNKDYEMQEVLDDYLSYCYKDNLIADSWKRMKMQLCGATYDFNVKENLYYNGINRPFSAHDYIGLYKEKSVKAIGKIEAIITANITDTGIEYEAELGELTDFRKTQIDKAIVDGKNYGYVLTNERYFFVERFYETDFRKVSSGGSMGSKNFDLTQVLDIDQLPHTQEIAELLKQKTWN